MPDTPSVIMGQVLTADGQPVATARLYFTAGPAPLPEIAALTDASGRFALSVPQPGTYQLSCAPDDQEPVAQTVTVEAGAPARVAITVA